ncbi:MAG: DUF2277 domain-containing protein [Deltaproteobacteria bacterium]|nr:DUF2277 domain-containing protein [Deltaproteobacteria bacterium]
MCRNIKLLFHFAPPATSDEIHASALQYVRKLSGPGQPTAANKAAFDRAVAEITAISERLLLEELVAKGPPRDREVEKQRAKARGEDRDARMKKKILAER